MGMGEREDYLATRTIDDKFIALDKVTNSLTTWSILTGRVEHEFKLREDSTDPFLRGIDFNDYQIFQFSDDHLVYQREWYSKVLLMSKKQAPRSDLDPDLLEE
jgi:hypothetical protein